MANEPIPWSNITGETAANLSKLAGVAGTLVMVASNPQEWLRAHVFALIAEWIVTKILELAKYVLGWMIFAYERVASIILDALGPLATPFTIVGDAVVGAIETLYAVPYAVATSAGLAAPIAATFAVAVVLAVLAAVAYGLLMLLPGSDFVEGGLGRFR